jgi:hypothetical protein
MKSKVSGCTNSGFLVARTTKFCTLASNIFSTMIAFSFFLYTNIHALRRKASDNTESVTQNTPDLSCPPNVTCWMSTLWRPELVNSSRIFGKVCGYLGKILTRKAVKVLRHNSISVLSWGQLHLFSTFALDGIRSSRSLLGRQPVWLVLSEKFQSARYRTPVSQFVVSYFINISHP